MTDNTSEFNVTDKETFIEFINLLREDLVKHPGSWKNNSLESFLGAFAAYAEDVQGYYNNMKIDVDSKNASWSIFADLFRGAKVYE